MAEYDPERSSGRIRLRLLQAENIYRVPAIYKCPVMAGLSFSYTYEQEMQLPVWAMTRNNFEEKNITEDLRSQGVVNLFYETEHRRRTMYLGCLLYTSGGNISGEIKRRSSDNQNIPVRHRRGRSLCDSRRSGGRAVN